MWYLWCRLEEKDGQDKVHKNKQQSIRIKQSLTEAKKNHLII